MRNLNLEKAKKNLRISNNVFNAKNELPPKFTKCKTDHVITVTKNGRYVVNYFACPKFAEMQPKDRLNELKNNDLCFQYLNTGIKRAHYGFCLNI